MSIKMKKREIESRESGGSTHYYSFPTCSETKDIIRYKKFKWGCKFNELKCIFILFYVVITVMTIGIVMCPM